ncbi:polymeric immunoglobulin receptor-like [Centroberyx affinis]|uniref:polymeric immunoglobulin receptor-like n=1 Tax=Centroberyx affinis TaxID=166261 RepID=UPI003A5B9CB5
MATHLLSVLLTLAGLTGIHSITTVSKVSVKAGGSISIPCLYDARYINHVKCLCHGNYWSSCTYVVKTNQPSLSGKFSISDDTKQRIFTVTINDLVVQDTSYYWCAVEIDGGADVREYFHLSVSRGMSGLNVVQQQISGFNRGHITIRCHHSDTGQMKWCRLGKSCVEKQSGSIDGTPVTINSSAPNIFTVTMSGLKIDSSGWYLCAKGDLQMPVRVTVREGPSTTTTMNPIITNRVPDTADRHWSQSIYLKTLIVPLSLLIFIVMVTLFIWWKLRRRKQAKAESSASTKDEQEITYSDVWHVNRTSGQRSHAESDDVTYSTVAPKQHRTVQRQNKVSDDDVAYSTVSIKPKAQPKVEPNVQSVIYTTVTRHQK